MMMMMTRWRRNKQSTWQTDCPPACLPFDGWEFPALHLVHQWGATVEWGPSLQLWLSPPGTCRTLEANGWSNKRLWECGAVKLNPSLSSVLPSLVTPSSPSSPFYRRERRHVMSGAWSFLEPTTMNPEKSPKCHIQTSFNSNPVSFSPVRVQTQIKKQLAQNCHIIILSSQIIQTTPTLSQLSPNHQEEPVKWAAGLATLMKENAGHHQHYRSEADFSISILWGVKLMDSYNIRHSSLIKWVAPRGLRNRMLIIWRSCFLSREQKMTQKCCLTLGSLHRFLSWPGDWLVILTWSRSQTDFDQRVRKCICVLLCQRNYMGATEEG